MAEKRRFLDVWIIDSNTVYREVPFPVVADWVQQGRLLENDMLRRSGTAEWFPLGSSPDFVPYLPRVEPHRVEDQAEALEPVELDFRWKRSHDEDESDVDMIPLIDVSLVLMIFFMMIGTAGALVAKVPTPPAEYGSLSVNNEEVQINIDLKGQGDERRPVYSLAVGGRYVSDDDKGLQTMDELLARLSEYLNRNTERVEVTINAHPDVKSGIVRDLTARLESHPFRGSILQKYIGVTEK
jgi:biopolymer transport protein ExbD